MIALYGQDIAPSRARPQEILARLKALNRFFGSKRLSQINGSLCRAYVEHRGSDASARRELEDLRAAVNHYHDEGHVREVIKVVLPDRRPARERWLTRKEAAHLLRSAWRYREIQKGQETARFSRRHVARFILVGLYTGRRAGAIVQAALQPTAGRGWIDLDRGVVHPAPGMRQTKKRQPAIPLPRRLLAHMRRWKANGQRFVVEWNGAAVSSIDRAFRNLAHDSELPDVTPHTLRHTAATWMMQRAADPWAASGYLGMSLETLLRVYGHHHPEHLKGAWSVFDRPGGTPRTATRIATGTRGRKGNKRRRPKPKKPKRRRSR